MPRAAAAVLTAAVLALTGCRNDEQRTPSDSDGLTLTAAAPEPEVKEFTGTLRGGAVAIGGETTGWRLEGDGETGGIEVDVSKVRDDAKRHDGKRVTIKGRMTRRSGPERGEVQVLVATSIRPAPQPGK